MAKEIPLFDDNLRALLVRRTRLGKHGCWEWAMYRDSHGYGKLSYNGHAGLLAHRMSFLSFKGPIGEFDVCHKCDNPPCINPDHLFLGTAKDNARDMMRKSRHPFAAEKTKTHCKRGHSLAGKNLRVHKNGRRQCILCMRMMQKSWAEKNPEKFLEMNRMKSRRFYERKKKHGNPQHPLP